MQFERLSSAGHPLFDDAMALYRLSFPSHEQREAPSQARILSHPEYHFTLMLDEGRFVGEMLYWEQPAFLYVEHFCILPALRNRRYGQRALSMLCAQGKTVILEIDPPEDETARRRQGFYQRCGFTVNPFPHVHPPYHASVPSGHPLVVMSCPDVLSPELYRAFNAYLESTVMADVTR